ncbi:MAG: hypothetical protein ACPL28_08005 [bacterium]
MKEYKDWLEEVWEIKKKIAEETKTMSFGDYLKYLNNLAQKAEKRLKTIEKIEKS